MTCAFTGAACLAVPAQAGAPMPTSKLEIKTIMAFFDVRIVLFSFRASFFLEALSLEAFGEDEQFVPG
jgi:hypothetical protein